MKGSALGLKTQRPPGDMLLARRSPAGSRRPAPLAASSAPTVVQRQLAQLSSTLQCVPVAEQARQIRERVCREHLAGGLLYLEAGEQILRNGSDVFHAYRADSNFFYVTGVNEPGFACLVDTDRGASCGVCMQQPHTHAENKMSRSL
jgi:hypothetical protein